MEGLEGEVWTVGLEEVGSGGVEVVAGCGI